VKGYRTLRLRRFILYLFFLLVTGLFAACMKTTFDSAQWKEAGASGKTPYVRLKMADHLIASRALYGKTKEEIFELLGEPSKAGKAYFPEYDFVYWLGPERSFISIDSEWLAIKLDSTSQVGAYELTTD
jgi:hypothetical protein